jgi:hypothetical protein
MEWFTVYRRGQRDMFEVPRSRDAYEFVRRGK